MAIQIYTKQTNELIPAGAVYVAPNGLSSNAGTPTSPKDFMSAYNSLASGGTLVLAGSVSTPYRLPRIAITKRVNLIGKPGNSPVISGAKVIPSSQFVFEAASGTYYKDNYDVVFAPPTPVDSATPERNFVLNLQQVFIDGTYLYQVGSKSSMQPGQFYYQAATATAQARLYIKDNPAGKLVEVSEEREGLVFTGSGADSKVAGVGIEKYAYNILVQANRVKLIDVTCFYGGFNGIRVNSGDNVEINNTDVAYAGACGLMPRENISDLTISGGKIFGNNIADFATYYTGSGIKAVGRVGVFPLPSTGICKIRGVEFYNNRGHAIWLDANTNNFRISKNIVHDNLFVGIYNEVSHGNYIVDNLVYNNNVGIQASGAKNVIIANNTVVMNNKNIVVKDISRRNPYTNQFDGGLTWANRDNQVYNNIMDSSPSTGSEGALYHVETGTSTTPAMMLEKSSNNAYYRKTTTTPQSLIRWHNTPTNKVSYDSLTDFRADNPAYEIGSIGRTALAAHPYFADADFTIRADSPTKNAGTAVSGVVAEILGVAPGTVVDIGASINKTGVSVPNEPVGYCEAEIIAAVTERDARINELNDLLVTANARIRQLEASGANTATIDQLRAERDAALAAKATAESSLATATNTIAQRNARILELEAQVAAADTTSVGKLAEVKTQLTATLNYIG